LPQRNHNASDMEKGLVHAEMAFVTDHQSAEVGQPCDRALHDPAMAIAPQRAPILGRRPDAAAPVRADQFDTSLFKSRPQRVTVVCTVGDQAAGFTSWCATAKSRNANLLERRFQQSYFRWCGRG